MGMTTLSTCEENPLFCYNIARRLGEETIYKIIVDDWRKPVIDGLLATILYYEDEVDKAKIRKILEMLGYEKLYDAIMLTKKKMKEELWIKWGKAEIEVNTHARSIRIIVDNEELFNKILELLDIAVELSKWKGWCKPRPDLDEIKCRYYVIGNDVEIELTLRQS